MRVEEGAWALDPQFGTSLHASVSRSCMFRCDWRALSTRYKKIYEDYKPEFIYWKVVLLIRK